MRAAAAHRRAVLTHRRAVLAPRRRVRGAALLALSALGVTALAALLWPSPPDAGPQSPPVRALRIASGSGIATGFAVGAGRVVTVAHVLAGRVTVGSRRGRVLRVDRRSDLALLSVPGVRAAAPEIASAADGEHLRLVRVRAGARTSLPVRVRRAIVARVRAPGAAHAVRRPALELSARVASGDSGAPLVTESGALAGILFAASRRDESTAYAVDAGALDRLLDRR